MCPDPKVTLSMLAAAEAAAGELCRPAAAAAAAAVGYA